MGEGEVAIPGPLVEGKNSCLVNHLEPHGGSQFEAEHDFDPSDDGFSGGFDRSVRNFRSRTESSRFRKAMANQSRRTGKSREWAWVNEGRCPHDERHSYEEEQGHRAGERRPNGQDLNGSEGDEDDE
jgi:hypothetical protein